MNDNSIILVACYSVKKADQFFADLISQGFRGDSEKNDSRGGMVLICDDGVAWKQTHSSLMENNEELYDQRLSLEDPKVDKFIYDTLSRKGISMGYDPTMYVEGPPDLLEAIYKMASGFEPGGSREAPGNDCVLYLVAAKRKFVKGYVKKKDRYDTSIKVHSAVDDMSTVMEFIRIYSAPVAPVFGDTSVEYDREKDLVRIEGYGVLSRLDIILAIKVIKALPSAEQTVSDLESILKYVDDMKDFFKKY
jgi:hypothetical protein